MINQEKQIIESIINDQLSEHENMFLNALGPIEFSKMESSFSIEHFTPILKHISESAHNGSEEVTLILLKSFSKQLFMIGWLGSKTKTKKEKI